MTGVFIYPILVSSATLLLGLRLIQVIKKTEIPTNTVLHLAQLVEEGTSAFAKRIIVSMLQVMVYLTGILFIFSWVFNHPFSWTQIGAFLIGASFMTGASLYSLRNISVVIPRIIKQSDGILETGLTTLYQASAAIGFLITGTVILGVVICQYLWGLQTIIGYGVGCMFTAFFLRIGGGIFKASADISCDGFSKNNLKISNFDKRNPATLLDITGDIIGEILGFGSDILGSFIFAITACSLFSVSLLKNGIIDPTHSAKLAHLPLYVMTLTLAVAVLTYLFGLYRLKRKSSNFLLEGIYISVALCGIGTYFIIEHLNLNFSTEGIWGPAQIQLFIPYVVGLIGAVCIGFTAEIMTSRKYGSAIYIARQSSNGPVISLFNGLSLGLKSSGLYIIYILAITGFSLYFAGFYGLCLAALGMLSATPTILIANIFSPLSTGTHKIAKLADQAPIPVKNTQRMETIGFTTTALGNGFSAGTSAVATMALFFALITLTSLDLRVALLLDIPFFFGLVIGIVLPLVFSGFLLSGLTQTVLETTSEVKRQFQQIPYLLEDKAKPDMITAARHTAGYAIAALTIPGFLMGLVPIFVGFFFGIKPLLGVVLGTFLTGMNQGYCWSNTGDALNNAKRYIETGHSGGPDSPNYAHISIADNIGDAFKDMLGPSMNLLIKSVSIIAVLVMVLLT